MSNATRATMQVLCSCGARVELLPDQQAIFLTAAYAEVAQARLPVKCKHRSEEITAKAECECGGLYSCLLLGKLCSLVKPKDEWTFAGDVRLDGDHFQCCKECGSFEAVEIQQLPVTQEKNKCGV